MRVLDLIVRTALCLFLAIIIVKILPMMAKDYIVMYRECFPKKHKAGSESVKKVA